MNFHLWQSFWVLWSWIWWVMFKFFFFHKLLLVNLFPSFYCMKSIVKRKVSPTLVLVFHRYLKFILLPNGVILGMPQLYIKRVDPMSSSTMYMSLMAIDWRLEHLEQCGWYLDCPKIKPPPLKLLFKINCWTSNKEETNSYEERWFRPSSDLQGQVQSQTLEGEAMITWLAIVP
jgi:hypothetical protein